MTVSQPMDANEALAAADREVEALVEAALAGEGRARVTNAPAGAGKTGAVVKLSGRQAQEGAGVGVVAQTNAQAFDIVRRAAAAFPDLEVGILPARGVTPPEEVVELPNVRVLEKNQVGSAPICVATADRWAYLRPYLPKSGLDAGVIDEAYQMTSAKLLRVADLFGHLDLVGDPGQLEPFSPVGDNRWRGLSVNPVASAVDALLAHHSDLRRHALPVTRRLPATAADVVREAFYPDLTFWPATTSADRELALSVPKRVPRRLARASEILDVAAETGWAYAELPRKLALQTDREIVATIADIVEALFLREPMARDERDPDGYVLEPERVAVGVSHRDQRAAVTVALQERGLGEVVVDTANRLQGREFELVIVWHPLSGRSDASAFHLDSGRLCVLTTRHRQACIVVGRAGIKEVLEGHPPPSELHLGVPRNPELDGWEAHSRILDHLASVAVPCP